MDGWLGWTVGRGACEVRVWAVGYGGREGRMARDRSKGKEEGLSGKAVGNWSVVWWNRAVELSGRRGCTGVQWWCSGTVVRWVCTVHCSNSMQGVEA